MAGGRGDSGDVDGNLYADIPASLPAELTDILYQRPGVRIERIVSRGHCSPAGFWYDQPEDEVVVLLRGSAGLEFAATPQRPAYTVTLAAGDHLLIPAHRRHRVAWTAGLADGQADGTVDGSGGERADAGSDTVWLVMLLGVEGELR